jgi:hypothetical protein
VIGCLVAPEQLALVAVVERQGVGPERGVALGALRSLLGFHRDLLDRTLDDLDQHLPFLGIVVRVEQVRPLRVHPAFEATVLIGPQLALELGPRSFAFRIDGPRSDVNLCNIQGRDRIQRLMPQKPHRPEFVVWLPVLAGLQERP